MYGLNQYDKIMQQLMANQQKMIADMNKPKCNCVCRCIAYIQQVLDEATASGESISKTMEYCIKNERAWCKAKNCTFQRAVDTWILAIVHNRWSIQLKDIQKEIAMTPCPVHIIKGGERWMHMLEVYIILSCIKRWSSSQNWQAFERLKARAQDIIAKIAAGADMNAWKQTMMVIKYYTAIDYVYRAGETVNSTTVLANDMTFQTMFKWLIAITQMSVQLKYIVKFSIDELHEAQKTINEYVEFVWNDWENAIAIKVFGGVTLQMRHVLAWPIIMPQEALKVSKEIIRYHSLARKIEHNSQLDNLSFRYEKPNTNTVIVLEVIPKTTTCGRCNRNLQVGTHGVNKLWPTKLVEKKGRIIKIYHLSQLCNDCQPNKYTAISHQWNVHDDEKLPMKNHNYAWIDRAITSIRENTGHWFWMDQLCIRNIDDEKAKINWYFSNASKTILMVGTHTSQQISHGVTHRLWCVVETMFAKDLQSIARNSGAVIQNIPPWIGKPKSWLSKRIGALLCGDTRDFIRLIKMIGLTFNDGEFGMVAALPGKRRVEFGWCWAPEDPWIDEEVYHISEEESSYIAHGTPAPKFGCIMSVYWCDGTCNGQAKVWFSNDVVFAIEEQYDGYWHVLSEVRQWHACSCTHQIRQLKLARKFELSQP